METKSNQENVRQIKLPRWNRDWVIKFTIVFGFAATGTAMMAGGLLAWVIGEEMLLLTGVLTGAVFVSAGGLGLLKCLDSGQVK